MTHLTLRRGHGRRARAGHPWIFSNELESLSAISEPGASVEIRAHDGQYLGTGYANPHSLIAVRLLSRRRGASIDTAEFFIDRFTAAAAYRRTVCGELNAARLVHGEADGLPGLVVDRYHDVLVVQLLTAGMEQRRQAIIAALVQCYQPRSIFARNDSASRELEGLPRTTELLYGEAPGEPEIDFNGLRFAVDVSHGQKTGLFLDQRDNYAYLERLAAGRRVLDLFCYVGAWSQHAARFGASEVLGVDISQAAVERARAQAARNGLDPQCSFLALDGFAYLRQATQEQERFGLVVLDPPAFIKSRRHLEEGTKGYLTVNRRALELVEPGGFLVTCSCSHHMERASFLAVIAQAAQQARRNVRLIEMRGQAADHPILPACPETDYLKCAILAVE